jgi:hypothetical protein
VLASWAYAGSARKGDADDAVMRFSTFLPSFGEPLFSLHQHGRRMIKRVRGFFNGFIQRSHGNQWLGFHVSWAFTFNERPVHV